MSQGRVQPSQRDGCYLITAATKRDGCHLCYHRHFMRQAAYLERSPEAPETETVAQMQSERAQRH